jgi:hypothetical protein
MPGDKTEAKVEELKAVFEKYDGDIVAPENLRERITVEKGQERKHEFFDANGVLESVSTGGEI